MTGRLSHKLNGKRISLRLLGAIRTLLAFSPGLLAGTGLQAQTGTVGYTGKSDIIQKTDNTWTAMQTGFIHIPDSIQISVYWYWISDNISREGVIKDLQAMKKVGINRAFIGNVALPEVPYGKVKLFSDEWWDILHTALKTASQLGIEIGIFNGPGWSQSGGPWVKPEQSMRYLTSSEIAIKGPLSLDTPLSKPGNDFQDVRVIAYPVDKDFNNDIRQQNPKVSLVPAIDHPEYLVDRNDSTWIGLKRQQLYTLDLSVSAPYTVRSLVIYPAHKAMRLKGELQVKNNDTYTTVKHFDIDRSNSELIVGFKPYGPAVISIPATTAKDFRVLFTDVSSNGGIAEIGLSSTPMVENYIEKTLAKMWQTPFPYWDAYQWAPQPVVDNTAAVIDPGKVIDISSHMSADGVLKWEVPAGDWIIERCGMLPTKVHNSPASPEGTGPETDKMSKQHIEAHFNAFLGEIMKRIPAEDRQTWKVAVEDSYETGGQNWSDQFITTFTKNYGYDPTPFIPVIGGKVVGSEDRSDRFLWDLRRLVADQVAYEYVGGLREICHRYGLTTWLENYGHWGFPGEFLQYGGQSDEVGGEFWSEGSLGNIENRAASSCAHIYGKNKVSAESFTCAGAPFSRYPALMKQRADRFFTEGINNTLLHVFIEQAADKAPGLNAPFGNEFNRLNTWFADMDIFLKYIKRCNFMLQQGKYVADVAYFISEDAPKMTGVQDPALPAGYSFDYINAEVIRTRLQVANGKLVLPDGMSYRILVLPKLATMRPELLEKIKSLVEQGAVVLGPGPSRSPSLQNYPAADQQLQALTTQLWGSDPVKIRRVGKGLVMNGMNLQEALDSLDILPDLAITETDHVTRADSALFIHRTLEAGDIYFISNQKTKSVEWSARFRVTRKVPELWDPVSGSIRLLPSYSEATGGASTSLQLRLAPLESAFILFRKEVSGTKDVSGMKEVSGMKKPPLPKVPQASGDRLTPNDPDSPLKKDTLNNNYPAPLRTIPVTGPWTVTFDSALRGPSHPVLLATLTDWTSNSDERIKDYSGAAFYHRVFTLSKTGKGEKVFLNLGAVTALAKITVNGIETGGVWTAPYRVDITSALKPGKNVLEIKVVNTWVNRLIGDSKLPLEQRKTWTVNNPFHPQSPLEPSGLLGPVTLEVITY